MKRTIPFVLVCLIPAVAHAQSGCTLNYLDCNLHEYSSTAPTYSLYCPPEPQQYGSSTVNYDLTTGAFDAKGAGREYGTGGGLTVFDTYQLVASSPPCGFTFMANLHVVGKITRLNAFTGCDMYAGLLDPNTLAESNYYIRSQFTTSVDTVLTIPLTECTTPFDLRIEMHCGAWWGDVKENMQLTFSGLPPGVSVTSCQSFHMEQPVATVPVSWGNLKATYR
jgi:hypothetical protein